LWSDKARERGACSFRWAPGKPAADTFFLIQGPAQHGIAGLVNLFGIESPGLTASLAIADHVAAELQAG
jgi:L-2-hydroxyglutarate oxidase LhgO